MCASFRRIQCIKLKHWCRWILLIDVNNQSIESFSSLWCTVDFLPFNRYFAVFVCKQNLHASLEFYRTQGKKVIMENYDNISLHVDILKFWERFRCVFFFLHWKLLCKPLMTPKVSMVKNDMNHALKKMNLYFLIAPEVSMSKLWERAVCQFYMNALTLYPACK